MYRCAHIVKHSIAFFFSFNMNYELFLFLRNMYYIVPHAYMYVFKRFMYRTFYIHTDSVVILLRMWRYYKHYMGIFKNLYLIKIIFIIYEHF